MSALPPAIMRDSTNLKGGKTTTSIEWRGCSKNEVRARRTATLTPTISNVLFFLHEKLQSLQLCRKAETRHNKMNQEHKLGKVPKAVLIPPGRSGLLSAGGVGVVDCTTQPAPAITPAPTHREKAATGRIRRIRASKETAVLICGPGGVTVRLLLLIQR